MSRASWLNGIVRFSHEGKSGFKSLSPTCKQENENEKKKRERDRNNENLTS
jgi:hypothetical protein